MRDVEDQEIVDEQIAQWMAPVWTERPRSITVEPIKECQLRVDTRLVQWPVFLGESKDVLFVVKITKLDAFRARISHRVCEDEVLDLRSSNALDPNRLAATRDLRLGDGADQRDAAEPLDYCRRRDLDHDR